MVMGDFITVRLMSGGQSASVGLMIANQISSLQYPAACANAVVLLADRADDDRGDPAHRRYPEGTVMAATLRRCVLLGVLGLFILFLYGPTLTILVLSFQGPDGGLTFPMNGFSAALVQRGCSRPRRSAISAGPLTRSFALATMVMADDGGGLAGRRHGVPPALPRAPGRCSR